MGVSIDRAAVLGSGVMGSALAAHLANAGIPTVLLDIVPPEGARVDGDPDSPEYRNAFATGGLKRALKSKPAAFFTPDAARLITVGNLEDDLDKLADCDFVLEAVLEEMDVKRSLFERIAPHLKSDVILATNTSGLSVTEMAETLPDAFRPRFLGLHFFNPPRYLHLLEVIPHAGTSDDVIADAVAFGEGTLGKGAVVAKDTPNFIANRVGTFSVMSAIRAMLDDGYTIEEVDAMTGPAIGRPRSATFRTADLVGLDIVSHAAKTVYDGATDDEQRDFFKPPEIIDRMVGEKMLGEKTGRGFFMKEKVDGKSVIRTLDVETFQYRERQKAKFGSLELAKSMDNLGERVRMLVGAKDRAGAFLWRTLSETLVYAANRVGEISDDIVAIDRAMKWGFGWELGPFELWDAIGVEAAVERLRADGVTIPKIVEGVLAGDNKKFYSGDAGSDVGYFTGADYKKLEEDAKHIDLARLKAAGKLIKSNAGASLVDVGDGVLCIEFHSKMNAIGADICSMISAGAKEAEANFDAVIVGNHGRNFSVGANVMLILLEAQEGNFDEIDLMVRQFQRAMMDMKYCKRPVVAAPFGMVLGGGCEVVLACDRVHASAETYMGLVEMGVGLIPAGGGCKELLIRNLEGLPNVDGIDVFPAARAAFETIGMARVSMSGEELRSTKMLRRGDVVAMNPDRLLYGAKMTALGMAREGYRRPDPTKTYPVAGEGGIAAIKAQLFNLRDGGHISEYDEYLGGELARVLCGGEVPAGTLVTEQYLLDLEREGFLRVSSKPKSHQRMQAMLKTGKPLRN